MPPTMIDELSPPPDTQPRPSAGPSARPRAAEQPSPTPLAERLPVAVWAERKGIRRALVAAARVLAAWPLEATPKGLACITTETEFDRAIAAVRGTPIR